MAGYFSASWVKEPRKEPPVEAMTGLSPKAGQVLVPERERGVGVKAPQRSHRGLENGRGAGDKVRAQFFSGTAIVESGGIEVGNRLHRRLGFVAGESEACHPRSGCVHHSTGSRSAPASPCCRSGRKPLRRRRLPAAPGRLPSGRPTRPWPPPDRLRLLQRHRRCNRRSAWRGPTGSHKQCRRESRVARPIPTSRRRWRRTVLRQCPPAA